VSWLGAPEGDAPTAAISACAIDSYLEFARSVPFREGARYYENSLRRADGGTSKGMFGRAVRVLADQEYESILRPALRRSSENRSSSGLARLSWESPKTWSRSCGRSSSA
jgi:hypothetical protein